MKNKIEKNIIQGLFSSYSKEESSFNARLLGIFSEDIVRIWCRNNHKRNFKDLGRPTITRKKDNIKRQLDFTLQKGNKIYIAESKCLPNYARGKYLQLNCQDQFGPQIKKPAFQFLMDYSHNPNKYIVTIKGELIKPNGSILIWASIDNEKCKVLKKETGLSYILSIEKMIEDLILKDNEEYLEFFKLREKWVQKFSKGMLTM